MTADLHRRIHCESKSDENTGLFSRHNPEAHSFAIPRIIMSFDRFEHRLEENNHSKACASRQLSVVQCRELWAMPSRHWPPPRLAFIFNELRFRVDAPPHDYVGKGSSRWCREFGLARIISFDPFTRSGQIKPLYQGDRTPATGPMPLSNCSGPTSNSPR